MKEIKKKRITSEDYGKEWPFTVESGLLVFDRLAVYFEYNGKLYGLNGVSFKTQDSPVEKIWRDNPDGTSPKISLSQVIQDGLALGEKDNNRRDSLETRRKKAEAKLPIISENEIVFDEKEIVNRILTIRGKEVMIDSDLAETYGVAVKRLNEQVKRNILRFPPSFMFQLSKEEKDEVVANCDHLSKLRFSPSNPYAFTEQGVLMAATILKTPVAIDTSVKLTNAFVSLRKNLGAALSSSLEVTETFTSDQREEIDERIDAKLKLSEAFEKKSPVKNQTIFYKGQFWESFEMISKIFKEAKESIIVIDSYIDETIIAHLKCRKKGVTAEVITNTSEDKINLYIKKQNPEEPKVTFKRSNEFHDRFIIIDKNSVYLSGASLKDAGNKVFCIIKLESPEGFIEDVLQVIQQIDSSST